MRGRREYIRKGGQRRWTTKAEERTEGWDASGGGEGTGSSTQINSEISLRRRPRWGGRRLCTAGQHETRSPGSEARAVSFWALAQMPKKQVRILGAASHLGGPGVASEAGWGLRKHGMQDGGVCRGGGTVATLGRIGKRYEDGQQGKAAVGSGGDRVQELIIITVPPGSLAGRRGRSSWAGRADQRWKHAGLGEDMLSGRQPCGQ